MNKGRFLYLKRKLGTKKKFSNENDYVEKIYKDLKGELDKQQKKQKNDINLEITRNLDQIFEKANSMVVKQI